MIPDFFKSTRVYVALGFVSWVLFVFLEGVKMYTISEGYEVSPWTSDFIINIVFATFCISVFGFFKFEIEQQDYDSFTDLLWKSLITSAVSLIVIIVTKLIVYYTQEIEHKVPNDWVKNILYHINITLLIIMLCNSFFIFKKMSLYLKTSFIDKFWSILGWGISFSTLLGLFHLKFKDPAFLFFFVLYSLALIFASFHIKWVAYFKYKQKLFSMINLFIMLIISLTFLEYFYSQSKSVKLIFDVTNNVFIMSLLTFSITYPLFSVLVLLFNLPTSSVFENKLDEVKNFQRLSQDAQSARNEKDIFESLLVGCFSASNASSSALLISDNGHIKFFEHVGSDYTLKDMLALKSILRKNSYKPDSGTIYVKNVNDLKHADELKKYKIKSLLWIPLKASNEQIGYLLICSEVRESFEKDGIEIIETYASQASVTIRYARLIEEKIINERYKAALNIAEKVQRSLLPEHIPANEHFDISIFYKTAEEVGGDYYDFYKISDHKYAIVIADVSGKGTSAAFYTAQLKGVFLTLAHFNLELHEVVTKMNDVMNDCLERKNFITLSMLYIDTQLRQITHIRAGHCPMLYYDALKGASEIVQNKGFGLGMVKKQRFSDYLEPLTFNYHKDDIILLYTDGLIEGKNEVSEEFGYTKLNQSVMANVKEDTKTIIKNITDELYSFISAKNLQDDCTIIAIKMK
ncbi:MAG TPA: SpoIIE family protein phosphatase [Cytophagales bacterium]|nr:SpoIIE family protein phosphatase [Cytophagales bacterium]